MDSRFHPDSYGYRPEKLALDAVGQARQRYWRYDWVIDLDIKAFFRQSLFGVLQFDLVASIGRKSCAPIYADDFHIQTVAVYANDYVVVGI
jgi:hypothetical protein